MANMQGSEAQPTWAAQRALRAEIERQEHKVWLLTRELSTAHQVLEHAVAWAKAGRVASWVSEPWVEDAEDLLENPYHPLEDHRQYISMPEVPAILTIERMEGKSRLQQLSDAINALMNVERQMIRTVENEVMHTE